MEVHSELSKKERRIITGLAATGLGALAMGAVETVNNNIDISNVFELAETIKQTIFNLLSQ